MTELKPCPFCGASEAWINVDTVYGPVGFEYQYIACKLCGGAMIDRNRNHCMNDIIKHWNMRDDRNEDYSGAEDEDKSSKDKGFGWRG